MRPFRPGVCLLLLFAMRLPGITAAGQTATRIGPHFDYSLAVVRTTMHRIPDAAKLPWNYAPAFFLYGAFETWQRTRDPKLLAYIEAWAASHVNAAGEINRPINRLDFIMPGQVLLALYQQTHQRRYALAAERLRAVFNHWPTTPDGGYWHTYSLHDQLWLDGTFMMLPYLVRYGDAFHDSRWCDREAVKQLLIYARHTNDPKVGLLYHAYDASGASPWAEPGTHHSSQFWARSIGWYSMALIITLHHLPKHERGRRKLLRLVRELAAAFSKYQDPKTGLWFQVVNRGDLAENWTETSASCMYTYFLARAVAAGYIPRSYSRLVRKAYRGILARVEPGHNGRVHLPDICPGTGVGDLEFYLHRPRATDDFHGLGAFLMMNEWVMRNPAAVSARGQ